MARAIRRGAGFVVLLATSLVLAAERRPVLHEFIPPDDGEDVALAVTTADGQLPLAIETRAGVVRAPDTERLPAPTETSYHDALSSSAPSTYKPDRDTRRPSMVSYDDPYSPSVAPYKRLQAFDLVGPDYTLKVQNTSLVRVAKGGEARVGEDEFYADLAVNFDAGNTVLIPSVGPGARIIRQHVTPAIAVEVFRDGADNWYARTSASRPGTVRLVMQVAIARAAFGGDFEMAAWSALPALAPLPAPAERAFAKVKAALGLSRAISPAENVKRLVAYFRAFVPSDEPPRGNGDIYLDLVLSQKGVCRHRSFAFLVTALGIGIPARMVMNEAHAWVEVQTDRMWQRVDLGGAAGSIDDRSSTDRPLHEPPPDAFAWPPSAASGSGQAAASRARQSASSMPGVERSRAANRGKESDPSTSSPSPASSFVSATPRGLGPSESAERAIDDGRSGARVTLKDGADIRVHRGEPMPVAGSVFADGNGCGLLRVDVSLKNRTTAVKTPVGALATDIAGSFAGTVSLPLDFPVGDYDVVATTPGDSRCGPSP
ncbi:MAG TPA: transglutaminase-like domain-containing protein [Polyangiaceae bacterium]|nr:transglutaminase-like domain-containing protein [Polyangiaceae bacterium]